MKKILTMDQIDKKSTYNIINIFARFPQRLDGRAVQGAAFRSQSGSPGVGSNPTSDIFFLLVVYPLLSV